MALTFADLEADPVIVAKINSKHGVTIDEVLDVLDAVINSEWDEDQTRGRRLYVWGRAEHRVVFVCLAPIDEERGYWRLRTAYPDTYP